jgi:hypothetical protein
MGQEQRAYLSYLLRLWQTQSGDVLVWRASLENARTGVRRSFADPAEMFSFLQCKMAHSDQGQATPSADQDRDRSG